MNITDLKSAFALLTRNYTVEIVGGSRNSKTTKGKILRSKKELIIFFQS